MLAMTEIENETRSIYHKAKETASGKKVFTPEQDKKLKALRKAELGAKALACWMQLPEEDLDDPQTKKMADEAMSLIGNASEKIQMLALEDVFLASLGTHEKPKAVAWAIAKGYSPKKVLELRAGGSGDLWGERWMEVSRWLTSPMSKAMEAGAFECARELALAGFAKVGMPDLKRNREAAIAAKEILSKESEPLSKAKAKLKGKDAGKDVVEAIMWMRDLGWLADELSKQHPILIVWADEIQTYPKYTAKKKEMALRELKKKPFEIDTEWGHPWFDAAAIGLAMAGSKMAMEACLKSKTAPWGRDDWAELAQKELFDCAPYPGEKITAQTKVAQARRDLMAQWIDQSDKGGKPRASSEDITFKAAIEALKELDESRWGRRIRDDEILLAASAWIEKLAPSRSETELKEALAVAQDALIEEKEAFPKGNEKTKALERIIAACALKATPETSKKRLLKA